MYAIWIKSRKEPLVVEDGIGELLRRKWVTNTLPTIVEMNGATFERTQVKFIDTHYVSDTTDERANQRRLEGRKAIASTQHAYLSYRSSLLNLTPEDRGLLVGVAELVWWANTGRKYMPSDVRTLVQGRQAQFFKEHPTHTVANPTCYYDVFERHRRPTDSHFTLGAMGLVERIIQADASCS